MKQILTVLLSFAGLALFAQTETQNYVKTKVYKSETTSGIPDSIMTIQYFDGLGRPIQSIAAHAGGSGEDIITPVYYDAYGRENKKYLPYATSQGNPLEYLDNAQLPGLISNYYTTAFPSDFPLSPANTFSETQFESSPLNRVLQQGAPGSPWMISSDPHAGHTVKFGYQTNISQEVRRFRVDFVTEENGDENTELTSLVYVGFYAKNQLYKTVTKDENWLPADGHNKTTEEFKDKEGRVVLKRNYNNDEPHDTYYVYDDFGNLSYVIPPLASDEIVITEVIGQQSLGLNIPWTRISRVDRDLADKYETTLLDYKNEDILNIDLSSEFGGSGGLSVSADADNNLSVSINITTLHPMPYMNGRITPLSSLGRFNDQEIGRISRNDSIARYDYIFSVRNNLLVIDGDGDVPSLSTTLTGGTPLDYNKVFTFMELADVDARERDEYKQQFYAQLAQGVTNPVIPNRFNGTGTINVMISPDDAVTLSINITATDTIRFKPGTMIPLSLSRRLPDIEFNSAGGFSFSLRENNLIVTSENSFTNLTYYSHQQALVKTQLNRETEGLWYIYHYDKRNRVVEKHIPDNGWTYIVYDKLDRPILTQAPNMRNESSWLFTKYDCFDRPAYTGKYISIGADRLDNQLSADGFTIFNEVRQEGGLYNTGGVDVIIGYSNDAYPEWSAITYNQTPLEVYSANYYDNYDFDRDNIPLQTQTWNLTDITTNLQGLATGSQVRVLGTNKWETSVVFYDEKARAVWTESNNTFSGSKEIVISNLDFLNKPLSTTTVHYKNNTTLRTDDYFEYDHMGRLVKQFQKINNGTPTLIAWNKYDRFGQLEQKAVGGANYNSSWGYGDNALQMVDYSYNIRGWLTKINNPDNSLATNSDLFAFKINYTNTQFGGGSALYNGNIAETAWRSKSDDKLRGYYYSYDALNRLTDANYATHHYLSGSTTVKEDFYEGGISYDHNGNILNLERTGKRGLNSIDVIDKLVYKYVPYSNRLENVYDAASSEGFNDGNTGANPDYTYDEQGNMLSDANKGILKIEYNHLNLPTKITFSGTNRFIDYTYTASGEKLQKKVTDGTNITTTDYVSGFVYENDALKYFSHPEGYVDCVGGFTYIYQYKDHLGNVRLSYKGTPGNLTVEEQNHYYPFGMKMGLSSVVNSTNIALKYKYNGKELQDELGLNMYDYGARNYDPALGKWINIDPKAETSRRFSPYVYALNNPVYFIDPDGMQADDHYNIHRDGRIDVVKTDDSFDTFNVEVGSAGGDKMQMALFVKVAQLEKNDKGLVRFPDNGTGFSNYGPVEQGGESSGQRKGVAFTEQVGEGDHYLQPKTAAALFGVIRALGNQGVNNLALGDMSSSNGSDPAQAGKNVFHHGGHGHLGKRSGLDVDFRYVGKDGNSYRGDISNDNFNPRANQSIYNLAFRFGFDWKNTYQGTKGTLDGVRTMGGHNNHGHLGMSNNPENFSYE